MASRRPPHPRPPRRLPLTTHIGQVSRTSPPFLGLCHVPPWSDNRNRQSERGQWVHGWVCGCGAGQGSEPAVRAELAPGGGGVDGVTRRAGATGQGRGVRDCGSGEQDGLRRTALGGRPRESRASGAGRLPRRRDAPANQEPHPPPRRRATPTSCRYQPGHTLAATPPANPRPHRRDDIEPRRDHSSEWIVAARRDAGSSLAGRL
jgi:hypothetical protein